MEKRNSGFYFSFSCSKKDFTEQNLLRKNVRKEKEGKYV